MRGWERERVVGWVGPLSVAVLALVLRLWHLGRPNLLVFDETYYAKDAYSLLQHGYVQDFVEDANDKIVAGDLADLMTGQPAYIAHPDGGKWLIALGEQLFGMDSFGWRVSAAVVGALTVLVLARLVRRLTGSTWVGCLAGLLLCLDGMHLVMSRTALLDVFLAFWVVAAVACLVADRDAVRARLDRHRPWRPWQLAAGLCFGMATATKWSGLYALAAFGLVVVVWEVLARRSHARETGSSGPRFGWIRTTLVTGLPAFVTIVGVTLVVYLVSWTGFLLHHELYAERYGLGDPSWGTYVASPTPGALGAVTDAFRSLWHFHVMLFDFHTGDYLAGKTHPYASNPLGWLVLERPVAFDAQNDLPPATCGAPADSSCMRVVTALGNPAVWWTGSLAVIASVVAWFRTRDGRWAVPVVGVAAGWLPWFLSTDRPIFSFYAVVVLPFMIVAVCLLVDEARRAATTARQRYAVGLVVGLLVVATVVLFWFFQPIWTDALISYDAWYRRMWFSRWI
ncbi:phospholipid carrier-dependent glycosyltransferase [Cytobacillus oceanisediminis]